MKADPKDPSSSESSSDDGEGEEEEREEDPDGEGSEQSELFESSVAPVAAGKSAPAPKGKHARLQRDRRFQSNFHPSHRLAGPRRCPRHCQKWSRRDLSMTRMR